MGGALEYSERGYCSGGLQSNREFCTPFVHINESVSPLYRNILFDPQTSGGLLVFCPPETAENFRKSLEEQSICAAEIGWTGPMAEAWIDVK
jgi:selenide,water dikinase